MKIKGFELKSRVAYDVLVSSAFEGDNILVNYVKILYDSIKQNWNCFTKIWYRWKLSPSKLLKTLTTDEIIKAVREIRILEGAKEEDLTFLDFQLGKVSEEDFLNFVEESKKKVETIQKISK